MRQAGTLPPDADAERFADYLLTLGIKTRIDAGEKGRIVWIKDEQDLEKGRQELAAFVANPADPRYRIAEDGARAIRKELEAKDQQYRKNLMDVRRRWAQPITGRARFTMLLMGLSIAVALFRAIPGQQANIDNRMQITSVERFEQSRVVRGNSGALAQLLPEVLHGQVWRLVTPIFVHFGLLHILFNMLMLQNMGTLIETREGTGRFLSLVLLTAVISNLAQLFFSNAFNLEFLMSPLATGIHQNPNFGGMSGVNYALFGYLWVRSRGGAAGYMIHPNTVFMMIGWMVLCMTGAMGNVANTAHVIGLAAGVAGAWLANRA